MTNLSFLSWKGSRNDYTPIQNYYILFSLYTTMDTTTTPSETITVSSSLPTSSETAEVIVIIKDNAGKELWSFIAEDMKSLQELAAMHGIDIPLACGGGVCGVCLCKVETGGEAIQPDKITNPIMPLPNDEQGNPKEILACVAGIKTDIFQDGKSHTIIIQKVY